MQGWRTDGYEGAKLVNESGGYGELLALLTGPADFWDRPAGDWPVRDSRDEGIRSRVSEARQDANAAYLLGTKALRRNELDSAEAWFAVACEQQHPGAAFRAALTRLQAMAVSDTVLIGHVGSGKSHLLFLLVAAARWGHGDAQHLASRLRTASGDRLSDVLRTAGKTADLPGDDDLAGMLLVADAAAYDPQDTEFYLTAQTLLEQCFPANRRVPGPSARSEEQSGAAGQQALTWVTSAYRLFHVSEEERDAAGESLGDWLSCWHSSADGGPGYGGDLRCSGRPKRSVQDLAVEDLLLAFPLVLWPRLCSRCGNLRTERIHVASQGLDCTQCSGSMAPFTAALVTELTLPNLVDRVRSFRRTVQANLERSDTSTPGSHAAFLWDDPHRLSAEATVTLGAQQHASLGQSADFVHRTFQEYLSRHTDASPPADAESYFARRAQWHRLEQQGRKPHEAGRPYLLAAAMLDGVDNPHHEQLAASVFINAGLSAGQVDTGFAQPLRSIHMVRDEVQRLYFFADPSEPGNPEEPRLTVPTAVSNPTNNSQETAQPITTTPLLISRRSTPGEQCRAEPLQVYALHP
jgi:hypothetical protein